MAFLQSPIGLILVGAITGIASGLFGIGGGLIMVPIFMYALKMDSHHATATSLGVVVLPVALPAVISYYKAGRIDLRVAIWVALGFALASPLGSKINMLISGTVLKRSFAVLLVYSAIQLWIKADKAPQTRRPAAPPPPAAGQQDTGATR